MACYSHSTNKWTILICTSTFAAQSDKDRAAIEQKDQELKASLEANEQTTSEVAKVRHKSQLAHICALLSDHYKLQWKADHASAQETIASLTSDLQIAREIQRDLDSQKHENHLLEETVARLQATEKDLHQTIAARASDIGHLQQHSTALQSELDAIKAQHGELKSQEVCMVLLPFNRVSLNACVGVE